MSKLSFLCCLVLIVDQSRGQECLPTNIPNATVLKTRDIYTLERPNWLQDAGMHKGIEHDRQHLGMILAADTTLAIRRVQGRTPLTLRLLNDDSHIERKLFVDENWSNITHHSTSVPFIDTPYLNDNITIEFEYLTYSKLLPVFKKHESEATFFSLWDKSDAEFALIHSFYLDMLIPARDKNSLKKLKSINGLIELYEKIFNYYNELTGLSFEPFRKTDKNIPNKYFFKANKSSSELGAYIKAWISQTGDSVDKLWLSITDRIWPSLTGIAYGYTSYLANDDFPTRTLWSFVYAAMYQDAFLGYKGSKGGWLYKGSKKWSQDLQNNVTGGINVAKWSDKAKVLLFMLIDEAAPKTFAGFNQKFRRLVEDPNFHRGDFVFFDFLSEYYIEASQINLTPFIERVGGLLSNRQVIRNGYHQVPFVYPLFLLINESILPEIKKLLSLKSPLSLVTPLQLAPTGIKGSVTINLTIDKFEQIFAETLTLSDGERNVYNIKISNSTIELVDLPIGVYALSLPIGKSIKYKIDQNYLIIKQGKTEINVKYVRRNPKQLVHQYFHLFGNNENKFGSIDIDFSSRKLTIQATSQPHYKYRNEKYVEIILQNSAGEGKFNKIILGTDAPASEQFEFNYSDRLRVFHAEPKRLKLHGVSQTINFRDQSNDFVLTPIGLENQLINATTNLESLIDNAANEIRGNQKWMKQKYMPLKNDVYLAMINFPPEKRRVMLARYEDVLPSDNRLPSALLGDHFLFDFLGNYDFNFLKITVDFGKMEIRFAVPTAGVPHEIFQDLYAQIIYQDSYGCEVINTSIEGNDRIELWNATFPLSYSGGEQLFIYHREACAARGLHPDRMVLRNEMQKTYIANACKTSVFKFVGLGLEQKLSF